MPLPSPLRAALCAVAALTFFTPREASAAESEAEAKAAICKLAADAQALFASGRPKNAMKPWKEAVARFRSYVSADPHKVVPPPPGLVCAAEVGFQMLEPRFEAIVKARLKVGKRFDSKSVQKQFKAHYDAATDIAKDYQEIAAFGDATYACAAQLRRALVLVSFAQYIREAPPPDSLGPEERLTYEELLEGYAGPVHKRGIKDLVALVSFARKQKLSNRWVEQAEKTLKELAPKELDALDAKPAPAPASKP